jgi:ribosomal-protein-alanine N-acetyltransferase
VREALVIGLAYPQDLSRLMDIERLCFHRDPFSPALYLSFLLSSAAEVYLYRSGENAAGSLVLVFPPERDHCHLVSVAVHPDYRNRGIGRELVVFAEERARAWERTRIRLEVRKTNATARRLYERLDYRANRVLRDYYGERLDGILYFKRLPDG